MLYLVAAYILHKQGLLLCRVDRASYICLPVSVHGVAATRRGKTVIASDCTNKVTSVALSAAGDGLASASLDKAVPQ